MKTILLVKMGGDFKDGEYASDMGNYRLRPTLKDSTECKLSLKNGGYIAGDFTLWEKNKTNNTAHDSLAWDFTEYDTKNAQKYYGACRFHGFDKYHTDDHAERLAPTLENIAKLLSDAIGEPVAVRVGDDGEGRK